MTNLEIVKEFFDAYKVLDAPKMNSLFSDDIDFIDPCLFQVKGERAKYFIQSLMENMENHVMNIKKLEEKDEIVTVVWDASYILKVNNKQINIEYTAHFSIKDNLIVKQVNEYDLTIYLKQAFGVFVALSYRFDRMKKMVNNQTEKFLDNYINNNELIIYKK